MANILSTLYPPMVDTFMPAFPYDDYAEINFTISPYNTAQTINYLHVTLVNQKTNQSVFSTESSNYPETTSLINGIWILPFVITDGNQQNDAISFTDRNGIIHPYLEVNDAENFCTLRIPAAMLKNERFVVDNYYKIQLRFDSYSGDTGFQPSDSSYLSDKRAYFSEWSSVCLLKAILHMYLHLHGFTADVTNYKQDAVTRLSNTIGNNNTSNLIDTVLSQLNTPSFVPGIIPIAGTITFDKSRDDTTSMSTSSFAAEYLKYYIISIRDNQSKEIFNSGIQYPDKNDKTNSFYYLCDLTYLNVGEEYSLNITMVTNNQYEGVKSYNFKIAEANPDLDFIFSSSLKWNIKKITAPAYSQYAADRDESIAENVGLNNADKVVATVNEDGYVQINVTVQKLISPGWMFLKRGCSRDKEQYENLTEEENATYNLNFKYFEILECRYIADGEAVNETFIDKTVGSLTKYQYAIQYLTQKGSWSSTFKCPEFIYPMFHDILLSRQDKQLAIRYNGQITSLTPVVNRVKIDTLGGQYPKFAENAKVNYKQFQLNGLLIAEGDYNRQFLNDTDPENWRDMWTYDNNMGGAYMVRNDTYKEDYWDEDSVNPLNYGTYTQDIMSDDSNLYTNRMKYAAQQNWTHDIYPMDNWWWERKFREEAIAWLNDGEPKLYRSMTEGNMIVMLNDITLTPNSQLGRRVWNFSCTVYEIGDGYSLKQLNDFGINPIKNDWTATFSEGIPTSSITREWIGQQYTIKANPKDVGNHGSIVVRRERNDQYQTVQKLYVNSRGQKTWSTSLTIEEQINLLYSGLYENYMVLPNTIKLHDLKVQFQSKPQWYQLDSNNQNSITAESFVFNITVRSESGESNTGYYHINFENGKPKRNNGDYYNISSTFMPASKPQSLEQWITEWETTIADKNTSGNNIYKVEVTNNWEKGSSNTNNFESPWHSVNKNSAIIQMVKNYIDFNTEKLYNNNYGLGYKLALNIVSPYDASDNADKTIERIIFVNEQGYYQVPDNIPVTQIKLFDEAEATIDYVLTFGLHYNDPSEPSSFEAVEKIVGQVYGEWYPKSSVSPFIKRKYFSIDHSSIISNTNGTVSNPEIIVTHSVDYWNAISFEGTPYAMLGVVSTDDTTYKRYTVGRSGVLNLDYDFRTQEIVPLGRRLVINKDPLRQKFLDEWECYLDDSVWDGIRRATNTEGNYWWILSPIEDGYHSKRDYPPNGLLVRVSLGDNYSFFDDSMFRTIEQEWFDLGKELFYSKYDVKEPEYNTVYGIINDMGFYEYKIYYLDQGWYSVEFPDINNIEHQTEIYAIVPVHGAINYKANIIQKVYITEGDNYDEVVSAIYGNNESLLPFIG